jgi:hypothetical protein
MQRKAQYAALRGHGPSARCHIRYDGYMVGPREVRNNHGEGALLTRSVHPLKTLFWVGAEYLGAGPEGIVKHLPMQRNVFRVAELYPCAEPVAEVFERIRGRRRHVDPLPGDEVDAIPVVLEDQSKGSRACHESFFSPLDRLESIFESSILDSFRSIRSM